MNIKNTITLAEDNFTNIIREVLDKERENCFNFSKIKPGFLFAKEIVPPRRGDEKILNLLVVREVEDDYWLCLKTYHLADLAGPFDIVVHSTGWGGSYDLLVETEHSIVIHKDDIGCNFTGKLKALWLDRVETLLDLLANFEHSLMADNNDEIEEMILPNDILPFVGILDSTNYERDNFEQHEQRVMEQLRRIIYESASIDNGLLLIDQQNSSVPDVSVDFLLEKNDLRDKGELADKHDNVIFLSATRKAVKPVITNSLDKHVFVSVFNKVKSGAVFSLPIQNIKVLPGKHMFNMQFIPTEYIEELIFEISEVPIDVEEYKKAYASLPWQVEDNNKQPFFAAAFRSGKHNSIARNSLKFSFVIIDEDE